MSVINNGNIFDNICDDDIDIENLTDEEIEQLVEHRREEYRKAFADYIDEFYE